MSDDRATVLFGSSGDLELSRDTVERRLRVSLSLHDSLYRGGDYYRGVSVEGELIIVQSNADLDGPREEVDRPTLVYIERTRRPDVVRQVLDGPPLEFVRQDDWDR